MSKDMVVRLMNSKTFCINKMQGRSRNASCQNRRVCKKWPKPEILRTRRSKTDQVSGTEMVLAQYPTIIRLKLGGLCGIQESTNKKG